MPATESMMRELSRRRQWVEDVNEEMQRQTTLPVHRAIWPDLKDFYPYHPRDAARMYLQATHQND